MSWSVVAPVVELAKAPRGVVVISPIHIQLLDPIEHVLAQLDVVCARVTALVLIRRNVRSMGLQVAQAITRHHHFGAFPLNQLEVMILVSRAIYLRHTLSILGVAIMKEQLFLRCGRSLVIP